MATATKQHSDFWLDRNLWDDDDTKLADIAGGSSKETDVSRLLRLATMRRAVGNFVSILSGQNVPVIFSSGKESYTDGKQVVISAEDDPGKFDPMVGLALHEGSHILLSNFGFLAGIRNIQTILDYSRAPFRWQTKNSVYEVSQLDSDDMVLNRLFPQSLKELLTPWPWEYNAESNYTQLRQIIDDLCFLMNVLEDRRIDLHVYKNAVGYRPYYDALYTKYFFTQEIGKNLRFNPEWRKVTVDNYLKHILYCIHPQADHDALPKLKDILRRMDLRNIDRVGYIPMEADGIFNYEKNRPLFETKVPQFHETPMLWQEACHLYVEILKVVGLSQQQTEQQQSQSNNQQPANEGGSNDLPNMDHGLPQQEDLQPRPVQKDVKGKGKNQQEVDGKFNEQKANREMEIAKKVMNGTLNKKKLKKSEREAVDAMDSADALMVEFEGHGIPKGSCMVTRKVTDAMLSQDWFIFGRSWTSPKYLEAISAGKRMGQILVHRLQVRNDPMMTKQIRLPQGNLDRRMLAQLGMDITSVFQKSRVDQHRPAMLHLTIDASGSMAGKKWEKVLTVATALAYTSTKLRNVDCVISIRGGDDIPMVCVLFDSRKDQFSTFYRFMQKIAPNGSTPEGLCFAATMDLILENTQTHDVYFINFSDGEPSFSYKCSTHKYGFGYFGEIATKHTAAMIRTMREAGVKILSYFIDDTDRYSNTTSARRLFKLMYGENATYVNVQNAGEVIFTLNKLLLKRGT